MTSKQQSAHMFCQSDPAADCFLSSGRRGKKSRQSCSVAYLCVFGNYSYFCILFFYSVYYVFLYCCHRTATIYKKKYNMLQFFINLHQLVVIVKTNPHPPSHSGVMKEENVGENERNGINVIFFLFLFFIGYDTFNVISQTWRCFLRSSFKINPTSSKLVNKTRVCFSFLVFSMECKT